MTHDTGFDPNPFHGILSLATCKPLIRLSKRPGDYIAGFTSKQLYQEKPGQKRLVFIMKVTEKITYDQYWDEPRFASKKPGHDSRIQYKGDNICKPINQSREFNIINYEQVPNFYHEDLQNNTDLKGRYVLQSEDFFYFGSAPVPVHRFKISIPVYQTPYGYGSKDALVVHYYCPTYAINSQLKNYSTTHPILIIY